MGVFVLSFTPAHQDAPSTQKLQNEPTEPTALGFLGVLAVRLSAAPLKSSKTKPSAILSHPPKPARTCLNLPPHARRRRTNPPPLFIFHVFMFLLPTAY